MGIENTARELLGRLQLAVAYEIEFYEDDRGNEPALAWMQALEGVKKRAIGVAINEVLCYLGPNVAETGYGRNLKDGLYEFKLDQNAAANRWL